VLIPRGSANLIKAVVQNSTVPVIETGAGNCHVYVDEFADIDMAVEIINNAKTRRISVCNTAESLLIHKNIAEFALIAIKAKLDEKNVILYGDEVACEICPDIEKATEEDWTREYLDYKLSVKIVSSIDEAIEHIRKYSTHHSESIVTESLENAEKFLNEVDSAAVYHNVSTAFTDGGEFGFGAEIGISTQKLHARGPLGLEQLNSFKYKIYGNGQVR
jgi:glutamate-5-semialdehyde dehydrogenase